MPDPRQNPHIHRRALLAQIVGQPLAVRRRKLFILPPLHEEHREIHAALEWRVWPGGWPLPEVCSRTIQLLEPAARPADQQLRTGFRMLQRKTQNALRRKARPDPGGGPGLRPRLVADVVQQCDELRVERLLGCLVILHADGCQTPRGEGAQLPACTVQGSWGIGEENHNRMNSHRLGKHHHALHGFAPGAFQGELNPLERVRRTCPCHGTQKARQRGEPQGG